MDKDLIVFILSILIALFVIVINTIEKNKKNVVLNNSEKLKKISELNNSLIFSKYKLKKRELNYRCNSVKTLRNLSLEELAIFEISKNEEFKKDIELYNENRLKYYNYLDEINKLKELKTPIEKINNTKLSEKRFKKIENKYFNNQIIKKQNFNLTFYINAFYISPAGRNYYNKDDTFIDEKLVYFYNVTKKRKYYKISSLIERDKVTNSLRYDVFKRDGFKCRICGVSASEGAKLHVDHIIPVSRGGKTTMSNLQTLCDRCNIGKSNKM